MAIGSSAPPIQKIGFRPPGREPLLGTPKVTLCNTFNIKSSKKEPLVCNIHGYKFTHDEDLVGISILTLQTNGISLKN